MATDEFNHYYTIVLTLVIGLVAIGVAVFNWSNFSTLGHAVTSIVAGAAIYISALTLFEGPYPALIDSCPRCGGPIGRGVSGGTDDIVVMASLSLSNAFASFQCAKCGTIPSSAFPLKPRILAILRSLRWLALSALAFGAIIGIFFLISLSQR